MTTCKQAGFTLLEMMVALVIFAILSLMGNQILQGMMRNGEVTQQHANRLSDTVRLFALLEQDLSQALIPQTEEATSDARFNGFFLVYPDQENLFRLVRRNWLNPNGEARSSLQKVAWRIRQSALTRVSLSDDSVTARFNGIDGIGLRFLSNGSWKDSWADSYSLPQAVEITLTVSPLGSIQRVIIVSGSDQ